MYGAIEAGGTKFRVAIGDSPSLVADATIPTTDPETTIAAVIDFFGGHDLKAVGIAAFGPLDLDPASDTHGSITTTPKPGWSNTPLKNRIADALRVPVGIAVDVGGAALGERRWGAARDVDTFVYFTIGTGIGGGFFTGNRIHTGYGHPEMGHIVIAREPDDDFVGHCPFHGACFEGMAAGPAISARWGDRVANLHSREEVWDLEARYIAQAFRTVTYVLAPQRIIVGGGVLQHDGLLDLVRSHLSRELAGYGMAALAGSDLANYVVEPELGQDAGLIGAIAIAQDLVG